MSIPSPIPADDEALKNKILENLSASDLPDTKDIHVKAHDGSVVLEGTLLNQEEIEKAVSIAFTVEGVKHLDNQLTIRSGGIAAIASQVAADVSGILYGDKPEEKKTE